MRNSAYKCVRTASLIVCFAAMAFGQSLLEHATAAAGGSIAGASGKSVNKGIKKIFEKVNELGEPVPTPASQKKVSNSEEAAVKSSGVTPSSRRGGSISRATASRSRGTLARRSARRTASRRSSYGWAPVVYRAPEQPRRNLTKQDLKTVDEGASRKQVLAHLGPPAARVLIPEEGRLREIYSFTGRGKHLGWVQLTDGTVSSVKLDPEG